VTDPARAAGLEAEAFFGAGGRLARSHPGYEPRPGQLEMARAVAGVLDQGGTLVIEAPTGTGKTLAYLVPALVAGRRVVISTGTRNLQDQIFEREIPFLRERIGVDLRACVMKGRENYLCRWRMAQMEREPLLENLVEAPWVERLAAWSRETRTGDRSELGDLPDRLALWRDVNARADTCTGRRCPEYADCWLTRLKRRAEESQIVVVNHHLFFADLAVRSEYGAVLPDYDSVVFDEAHLLEEVATLYFGVQIASPQLEELARQAERLAARAGSAPRGGGGAVALRQAAAEFVAVLRRHCGERAGRLRFEPPERGGVDVEVEWAVLCEALDEVGRAARRLDESGDGADSLARRAEELRAGLDRVLERADPDYVYGIELRGRALVLSAAPIDVGPLLELELFGKLHAAVLTSATMTVEGRFDFFRERLGLHDAEAMSVESSFAWDEQAVLYLPRSMPEPSEPAFLDRALEEIVALLEASGGRAFLLFTSYAHLDRVARELAALDRWPLFVQGEGSKVALVERFRSTPGAVLCGTTSFWHGVDVAGEALSVVVIDKLPFDVPDDPLVAARIARIRERGGDPFGGYQVPLAVLELKQGLGRLLRSRRDRGVLAVLDPRLTTRRYGRTFLASLPPYRIVRERGDYRRFLTERPGGPAGDPPA
jgi:ATP-dependent DNA helicase DinG